MKARLTVVDEIERAAALYPQRPALSMLINYRTHSFTYAELMRAVRQTQTWLVEHGVTAGQAVLFNAPNSPHLTITLLATLRLGAVLVPLNTQSTEETIRSIVKETGAHLLFSHSLATPFTQPGIAQHNLDTLPELIAECAEYQKHTPIQPSDTAQIMYTSGTTGNPKGVMLIHQNLLHTTNAVRTNVHITPRDRILSILPLSHIYEQVVGHFAPLSEGAHIIYLDRPSSLLSLLQRYHITKLAVVPEFLKLLMDRIKLRVSEAGKDAQFARLLSFNEYVPSYWLRRKIAGAILRPLGGQLSLIATGGAPLDPTLERTWNQLGVSLLQGYGLTEVSGVATMNTLTHHRPTSVGKVIPDVEVTIAEDGEILLRGPSVFQEYFQNHDATAEAKDREAWFHTGDIGTVDDDGFLYIRGRKKYMILSASGQNVYPEDIETVLNEDQRVRDSCVFDITEHGRTLIAAAILLEDDAEPNDIIAAANKTLASYQTINRAFRWDEFDFPRSHTRKVQRHKVKEKILATHTDTTAAAGHSATRLTQLLAHVTGFPADDIHPESQLGRDLSIDSLLRVELVSRIELELGVLVDEAKLVSETTVAELDTLIETGSRAGAPFTFTTWPLHPLAHVGRQGILQPLFFLCTRLLARLDVVGRERIADITDPVIIMPNHEAVTDSILVARALPYHLRRRLSHAAGADIELFTKYGRLATFIRLLMNVFPLPRKAGSRIEDGLKRVGRMLDEGYSVVIFPEGHTNDGEHLLPLKPGAALIARHMGAPIIPLYLHGIGRVIKPRTYEIVGWRQPVTVVFGEPITCSPADASEAVLDCISNSLKTLKAEAMAHESAIGRPPYIKHIAMNPKAPQQLPILLSLSHGKRLATDNWESHVYALGDDWVYKEIKTEHQLDPTTPHFAERQTLQRFWCSQTHFENLRNDLAVVREHLHDWFPETFVTQQPGRYSDNPHATVVVQKRVHGQLVSDMPGYTSEQLTALKAAFTRLAKNHFAAPFDLHDGNIMIEEKTGHCYFFDTGTPSDWLYFRNPERLQSAIEISSEDAERFVNFMEPIYQTHIKRCPLE